MQTPSPDGVVVRATDQMAIAHRNRNWKHRTSMAYKLIWFGVIDFCRINFSFWWLLYFSLILLCFLFLAFLLRLTLVGTPRFLLFLDLAFCFLIWIKRLLQHLEIFFNLLSYHIIHSEYIMLLLRQDEHLDRRVRHASCHHSSTVWERDAIELSVCVQEAYWAYSRKISVQICFSTEVLFYLFL